MSNRSTFSMAVASSIAAAVVVDNDDCVLVLVGGGGTIWSIQLDNSGSRKLDDVSNLSSCVENGDASFSSLLTMATTVLDDANFCASLLLLSTLLLNCSSICSDVCCVVSSTKKSGLEALDGMTRMILICNFVVVAVDDDLDEDMVAGGTSLTISSVSSK